MTSREDEPVLRGDRDASVVSLLVLWEKNEKIIDKLQTPLCLSEVSATFLSV